MDYGGLPHYLLCSPTSPSRRDMLCRKGISCGELVLHPEWICPCPCLRQQDPQQHLIVWRFCVAPGHSCLSGIHIEYCVRSCYHAVRAWPLGFHLLNLIHTNVGCRKRFVFTVSESGHARNCRSQGAGCLVPRQSRCLDMIF